MATFSNATHGNQAKARPRLTLKSQEIAPEIRGAEDLASAEP